MEPTRSMVQHSAVGEWGHPEQYNLSREQMDVIAERAKRRAVLKNEYYRQLYNPWKNMRVEGGSPFDPALQRFASTRADYYHYFKANKKNIAVTMFTFVLPVTGLMYYLLRASKKYDVRCRNGEIPWRYRLHRSNV